MATEINLAVNVNALARAFDAAPEKTRKMVRQQVKSAVRDIREEARENHRFISRSEDTVKHIKGEAEGSEGVVWLDSKVAVYQHEGTPPHDITPRNKKSLRFVKKREFIFTKRVHHPGIKPDPYLYNAAEKMTPVIISRFNAALDSLLEG